MDASTWYVDGDDDGYGTDAPSAGQEPRYLCAPVGQWTATEAGDCDDTRAITYPGAPEQCDGLDNDCDGTVPANESDNDGDGYPVCGGDCDDDDTTSYPGATELCDGRDNDCDGNLLANEQDSDGDVGPDVGSPI